MTFEVEQKFHVDDLAALEQRLTEMGAVEQRCEKHSDTYYNHPSRDFAESREALRVRRVDGVPLITYKGTKLPGEIKARLELEWRLDPGDPDGSHMEKLLQMLSFRQVAVVEKRRRHYSMPAESADFGVMIDEVASLGLFAEVELIAHDSSEIEISRERIGQLSQRIGLRRPESRSYLSMILELDSRQRIDLG
jgi:adenylate cyclase class 2